ncbi:transglycosylase SLT domain-containing protein [Rhodococcus sp. T2V]|uniref:aggregation-promoting factor C-terminal-like domain-containing protein n=1 Tax=Rhodococcus sp. T2V TaxID=3034164 RepID=UPI0023E309D7|nr:transglycosylase SLT domain-containing protein [Rhodococcus sp. T2V]MDF3309749.1 transglycosylase SLT domain-containing protein [Rhodococcus sp. T2V]
MAEAFVNVLPSMSGYFKRVRTAIKANPVRHEIDVRVDERQLAKAKSDLDRASKGAADARRREVAATKDVVSAEKELQALRNRGVSDAGRLAAAEGKVAKAKRDSRTAADALQAAESKRSTAGTRVARIEARIDSKRAEAESATLLQRLSAGFENGGRTVGSRFVDGMSATMNSNSRGSEEGRSFAAGFVSAIGTGMRMAAVGFTVANDAARSVIRNVGMAAAGIGLAARVLKGFSAGLLVSSSLLKVMTGAGVAKLAGLLRLAAAAANILARDIGRVTSALLVMAAVSKLIGTLTRIGRALGMVTVGSAVALGAMSALGSVVGSFATGPLVAGLTAVAAAMGTVAAAAAGILGPAIGVAKMAFSGLSDGAKAWDKAQKAASTSSSQGASAMKAVESAKKSQARTAEQGARQIVDAEKRVVDAQKKVKEAQDDVNDARKEAKRDADGYARTLKGLTLDEKSATLAVAEARKNLRETKGNRDSDPLDVWRAELGVEEAEQALEEVKASNKEQRAEIAEAQAKGIEGSDKVVEAKGREVDAQEQLREAQADAAQTQKDVAQANIDAAEAVADAYQSMADAQQSATSGDDPFAAMIGQRLAPLLQAFKNLREEVTDRFSGAMTGSFGTLGGLITRLTPSLGGLSATLGNIGSQIATSISSPAATAGWERMIDGSNRFFGSLAQGESGIGSVFSGLISVLGTAAQTFADSGAGINGWLLDLGEKLRNISAEDLKATFAGIRQTFENISTVAGPLFSLFRGFGAEAASGLAPGFSAMGQAIQDAIPGLMDMARELMPALGQALTNLAPILPGLVEAFRPWADVIAAVAPHLATIIEKLAPLAPLLLTTVMAVKVIGVAITAWNAAMFAASVAQGVFAAATGRSAATLGTNTIALAAHRAALLIGTAATWAFNAAMAVMTSPITLVVVAIAALVGALIWFFTQTELGKAIWEKVWSGITTALSAAWDFIKGVFAKIGEVFGAVIGFIRDNWKLILPIVMGPLGLIIVLVTTFWDQIKTIFKVAIAIVITAAMLLWEAIKGVFTLIGNVATWVWQTYLQPGFELIKAGLQALGDFFGWVWNSLIKPAWDALGAGISWVYDNVLQPLWDRFVRGLQNIGDFFVTIWEKFIKPAWDKLGEGISWVIDQVVQPAWERFTQGLGKIRDFFTEVVKGIGEKWDSLKGVLAKPINFMINTVWNEGILKAWNKAAGLLGLDQAQPLAGIPERATGGPIFGPGTGTSDDVLMWGSNGEHMVTTAEVQAAGGHNAIYAIRDMILRGIPFEWDGGQIVRQVGRDNLNAYGARVASKGYGNVDPQGMFDWLLPAYKDGGEIRPMWQTQLENGHRAAKMRNGNPYTWGFEDCSGYMSMIADAIINGGDGIRKWGTSSFPGGQPFVPGLGEGFSVGVHDDPGGPGGGHTAGTLTGVGPYATVNVESGGGHGVAYGGPAVGADNAQFAGKHPGLFHLAIGADGAFESGGRGGGSGPSPDGKKSFVQQKITDIFDFFLNPIKATIGAAIGTPPPESRGVPSKFLDKGRDMTSKFLADKVTGLGDLLGSVWDKAKGIGGLFRDQGGWIPNGLSIVRNETGKPEAVLNWDQVRTVEDLMQFMQANAAAAGKYAGEIDWGGVGGQIGTSLLAEWGNDLLGMAGFSSQFEGMQLVDETGRSRSDEAGPRDEATYDEKPAESPAADPGAGESVPAVVEAPAAVEVKAQPESVVDAVKRAFAPYGWNEGDQWAAADWIVQKESGWNPLARNKSSGAFSLFQFLGSTKDQYLPDESEDPYTQGVAGAKYIRDRYGDPIAAKTFWEKNGFYDQGGIASGKGYLLKDVIRPERVLSPRQTEAFESLVPMLDRVQSAATAPGDVLTGADRAALEYAPVGGGDSWNFNGELSPAMRREVEIMVNQRERGQSRRAESRRRW